MKKVRITFNREGGQHPQAKFRVRIIVDNEQRHEEMIDTSAESFEITCSDDVVVHLHEEPS